MYCILEACSIWGKKTTSKGFCTNVVMDYGWKCDFEYVSIRKQNTSLQAQKSSRHRGAWHHGLMQGGGYTDSLILITSTCAALGSGVSAGSKPEPSTGSEGGERTALTCQRRAIKTFQIGTEVPVDLFCISPSTWEGSSCLTELCTQSCNDHLYLFCYCPLFELKFSSVQFYTFLINIICLKA